MIGDYGAIGAGIGPVESMIASWNVDDVLTSGDNVYDSGATPYDGIDGQYYHAWMSPYTGAYGAGSPTGVNEFWPALGYHDWSHIAAYESYFGPMLPHNGPADGTPRYYSNHLDAAHKIGHFAIDTESTEPDGYSATSTQGAWLKAALAADTSSCFKIVVGDNGPHVSTIAQSGGPDPTTDWPFEAWGADAYIFGQTHGFERLSSGGFPYFCNGIGGGYLWGDWNVIDPDSVYRFPTTPQRYGAQLITVSIANGVGTAKFEFYGVGDTLGSPEDSYTITKTCN